MLRAFIVLVVLLSLAAPVYALPFNDDMVETQNLRTGSMMRPRVPGTVAKGETQYNIAAGMPMPVETAPRMSFFMEQRTNVLDAKNPVEATKISLDNGKRLFSTNCSPCHGKYDENGHVPGLQLSMLVPELSQQGYAEKSDGHFFGYIYFGGASMPRYGWKLSKNEIWDIVNYVRKVQSKGK